MNKNPLERAREIWDEAATGGLTSATSPLQAAGASVLGGAGTTATAATAAPTPTLAGGAPATAQPQQVQRVQDTMMSGGVTDTQPGLFTGVALDDGMAPQLHPSNVGAQIDAPGALPADANFGSTAVAPGVNMPPLAPGGVIIGTPVRGEGATAAPRGTTQSLVDMGRAIFSEFNTLIQNSSAEGQRFLAQALNDYMSNLDAFQRQITSTFEQQLGGVDQATMMALQQIRESAAESRRVLLEDLSRRGILQSGVAVEADLRLDRNRLTAEQQVLANRVTDLQNRMTTAMMSFGQSRLDAIKRFGLAQVDQANRAGDQQMSAMQSAFGLAMDQSQLNEQIRQNDRQFDLANRQFDWNRTMDQNQLEMANRQFDWTRNPNNPAVQGQNLQNQRLDIQNQIAQLELQGMPELQRQEMLRIQQQHEAGQISIDTAKAQLEGVGIQNEMRQLELQNMPEQQRQELRALRQRIEAGQVDIDDARARLAEFRRTATPNVVEQTVLGEIMGEGTREAAIAWVTAGNRWQNMITQGVNVQAIFNAILRLPSATQAGTGLTLDGIRQQIQQQQGGGSLP